MSNNTFAVSAEWYEWSALQLLRFAETAKNHLLNSELAELYREEASSHYELSSILRTLGSSS